MNINDKYNRLQELDYLLTEFNNIELIEEYNKLEEELKGMVC